MTNQEISNHFHLLAQLMELHEEQIFKIKSYAFAVRTLKNYGSDIKDLSEAEMDEMPGIGKTITKKIKELLTTGRIADLDKLIAKTPVGVIEMLDLKGFGPKKIGQLWKELDIETLGELYYACLENRIMLLKGFGQKSQDNLQQIIEFKFQNQNKFLWARIEPIALEILKTLKQNFPNHQTDFTGEFRSFSQTVEQLDFVTQAPKLELIAFLEDNHFKINSFEEKSLYYETTTGIRGHIYLTETDAEFIMYRFKTTGNKAHIDKVLATINDNKTSFSFEDEIYTAAKLPYIPCVLRENHVEFKLGEDNKLENIVELKDIKGIIHAHSNWSDGGNSLLEMAHYVKNQGFEYLGISDHSKSAFYANGLSIERVEAQQREIDEINKKLYPFKVFKGIESDILYDGQLDYPDEILSTFDFVIASIHSVLKMDEQKATARLISAIENPFTTILGHPTGRLLLSRKGYPIDFEKIIDACSQNGVAIELNANPHRLDIDWKWIDYAMQKGVQIAINPDAHHLKGIHDIRYGVYQAQKGGLTKDFLLNRQSTEQFEQFIKLKRNRY